MNRAATSWDHQVEHLAQADAKHEAWPSMRARSAESRARP